MSPRNIIGAFVRNSVLSNMLMVCILVMGGVAAVHLNRETYPEFSLDQLTIRVDYPGASPQEIEDGICRKVEEALDGLSGISKIWSRTSENGALIIVELNTDIIDPRHAILDVKDRLNRISTFPVGAEPPIVEELLARTDVINVAVYGSAPERTLKELALSVRDQLKQLQGISQIELFGIRDYEISIEVPREVLLKYGLTLKDISAAVSASSLEVPAGTLRTDDEELSLRMMGGRHTTRDFEDVVLIARPDGTLIKLGQLARITDSFVEDYNRGHFQGQPAIMLQVYRTAEEDSSAIARQVREHVARMQQRLPEGVALDVWADKSQAIDARISMLVKNGLMGMLLVIVVLTMFLDFRVSLYVALGVPTSFAGALAVMYLTGETLNMITLFGLIMATGIIVDDAIVIADQFRTEVASGKRPPIAAAEGPARVAVPVLISSLTTILAFIPLLFVAGIMGKLIAVLPVVIIASLMFSSIEAFVILPNHLQHCLKPGRPRDSLLLRIRQRTDIVVNLIITRVYTPLCRFLIRNKLACLSGIAACFMLAAGLITGGRVPLTLLPDIDANVLRARVRFVQGTPAEKTQAAVRQLEAAADQLNDRSLLTHHGEGDLVQRKFAVIGEWTGWLNEQGSNLCEVVIELLPAEQRRLDSERILAAWGQRAGPIKGALSLTFDRVAGGPKDKPLEIHLLGDDLDTLRQAAEAGCRHLAKFAGVSEIEHDLYPGRREVRFRLKPLAQTLGVTLDTVTQQLQSGFFGGEAVRVQRDQEEVRVQVRYPQSQRRGIGDIESVKIRSKSGHYIPLAELVTYEIDRGVSAIYRQDGKRRARITANVDELTTNTERVVAAFRESFLDDLGTRFPGVTYKQAGEHALITESMSSLYSGLALALVAIYGLLAAVLRSYVQPIIILIAVPLGCTGAVFGHLVTGHTLTLLSIFGMVALAGVVVNDALVLLHEVNDEVREGEAVHVAVLRSGQRRFRAICLTSLTTIAGMLPLLLEQSTQAQVLIPMAISITFGLAFATIVTLVVVPICYVIVEDLKSRMADLLQLPQPANTIEYGT